MRKGRKSYLSFVFALLMALTIVFSVPADKVEAASKSGWVLEEGNWAFYTNNKKATNAWKSDSKGWVYLGNDGKMVKNTAVRDSKGLAYIDNAGYWNKTEAWRSVDGEWTYIGKTGYAVEKQWVQDSTKQWTYIGSDGYMVRKAWAKDSTELWAYLGLDGYWQKGGTAFDSHGEAIIGDDGYFTGDYVIEGLEVVSVSAINAKTIEVVFTEAVDVDTLVKDDIDVITVVGSAKADNPGTITQKLSEDGKTLTLTATNIFKGEYTVKVPFEIIKGKNGEYLAPINAKVTVNDKSAPVLISATSTIKDIKDGVKEITLTFDEHVQSIDGVKIGNVNYSVAVDGNKATVTVDLDATKSYTVQVINATDAAGNIKDVQEKTLSITVDNVAPSILSVTPAGENTVTVILDKALQGDILTISGKVGSFAAEIVQNSVVNAKNNKEYTVTLDNRYLFKNGNSDKVTLTVEKEKLVDTLGNKNTADITKEVVVTKDTTAPGVVNIETSITDGKVTSFTIIYNEEVESPTATKVTVTDSKGKIQPTGNIVENPVVSPEDNKKVVFTLKADAKADKYSFDLGEGFVVDKALTANKSAKYSFNVDVTEAGKPVETSFDITSASALANVITVDFGLDVKATGTGSALNPSSYQLNGIALPANTVIKFAEEEGKIVQSKTLITLPEGFVKTNDNLAIFRVNGVQTLDNKVNNNFSKTIIVTDNTPPEVKSIVATDLDKLTVTYSEAIKLKDSTTVGDIKDEIKLVDSNGVVIDFTEAEVKDGKLVLTVEDASKVKSLITLKVTGEGNVANIVDSNDNAQKAGLTVSK